MFLQILPCFPQAKGKKNFIRSRAGAVAEKYLRALHNFIVVGRLFKAKQPEKGIRMIGFQLDKFIENIEGGFEIAALKRQHGKLILCI